jgi:general secretion pathway protein D
LVLKLLPYFHSLCAGYSSDTGNMLFACRISHRMLDFERIVANTWRGCLPRSKFALLLICASVLLSGCPKANSDYDAGRKAEATQDYDTALQHYQKALAAQPNDLEFKVRVTHMRFEAGEQHIEQGQRALHIGDLQLALAEFQKAQAIDPSSSVAEQQIRKVSALLGQAKAPESKAFNPNPEDDADLLSGPPVLKPLMRDPISLRMTNDSRQVFETIGKLAGLSVIFDPEYQSKRVTADLPSVTLEQALDAVAIESKSFWKPITPNIILIAPDQPQKRKDLEDEEIRTFYMSNTLTPQDLTEVVTGLRQLLNLTRVQQVNSQNAIVIRDTPDKLMLASKIIRDIDKAKPEVLLHVQVIQVSMDKLRDIGILPGQSVAATFDPRSSVQPQNQSTSSSSSTASTSSSTTTTTNNLISLDNLKNLTSADYSLTLPGAALNAIMTDTKTRIIQDPEVRVSDGEQAKLRIGNKVPVATGSFQAGVGVSATTSGVVNPLVNTQFTYLDVGVNIDVTPRIHPGGEVSMKLKVEVSSVTGTSTIGGISQPIISQRTVEHDIRLKEGEVNVLGGLIERDETIINNGWPGLGQIPFIKYLFADNHKEFVDSEVLIVLTPHILRLPSITAENLRPIAAGSDTNVRVYRSDTVAPDQGPAPTSSGVSVPAAGVPNGSAGVTPAGVGRGATGAAPLSTPPAGSGQLRFDPTSVTIKPGETSTISIAVDNAKDLFSIPLMIQYNPAVIQIDEARNGGFLSGGTQEIAIVQRVDVQKGQAIISATRQPNTPGVDGNGTVFGLIIHGVAPGTSSIQIVQVNARDSQQKAIPLLSGEATIKVQ